MNTLIRVIASVFAIGFTLMIGWASFRGDFGVEFTAITSLPWGQVSLVDLYLGFLIYGVFVWLVEERMSVRLLWALPILFLGNAWSLMWVAVRWNKIVERLKPRPQS